MKKNKPVMMLIFIMISSLFIACNTEDDASKSSEKEILSFTINGIQGNIDQEKKTITVTIPYSEDFDITSVAPTIEVSDKAKVSPSSDSAVDFTEEQTYIVTAEDETTQAYQVSVIVHKTSDAKILKFDFKDVETTVTIDEEKKEILVKVPYKTNLRTLVPVIEFLGKKVTPTPDKSVDLSLPINFLVEAQDGTVVAYKVTVEEIKTSDAQLLSLELLENNFEQDIPIGAEIKINEEKKEIDILIPATYIWTLARVKTEYIGASIKLKDDYIYFDHTEVITVVAQDETEVAYKLNISKEELVLKITEIDKTELISGEELTLTGLFGGNNLYICFKGEGEETTIRRIPITGKGATSKTVIIPSLNEGVDYTISVTADKENGEAYTPGVYAKKVQIKNPYLPVVDLTTSPLTTNELEAGDIEIRLKGRYFKGMDNDIKNVYITYKHESDATAKTYAVNTNAEGTELWTVAAVPHKAGKYTAYVSVGFSHKIYSKSFTYTVKE